MSPLPSPLRSASPAMFQSLPTTPTKAAAAVVPFICHRDSAPSLRRHTMSALPSPPRSPNEVDTSQVGSLSGTTSKVAARLVLPSPKLVLVMVMVALLLPGASKFAKVFTVNVKFTGEVVAVPDVEDAESQGGTPEIE